MATDVLVIIFQSIFNISYFPIQFVVVMKFVFSFEIFRKNTNFIIEYSKNYQSKKNTNIKKRAHKCDTEKLYSRSKISFQKGFEFSGKTIHAPCHTLTHPSKTIHERISRVYLRESWENFFFQFKTHNLFLNIGFESKEKFEKWSQKI